MDLYRNTLCLYLLVFITQTLVKSRSVISPPDLENKETPVEAEIDDAIEVLQETKHIRNKVKRSRINSKDNDNCNGRRRRSYWNTNRVVHGVVCCRKYRRARTWPSKCNQYLEYFRNIVNSEYSDA
ncbi:Hypothetical predicted protein [Mytilus galloprovincialis]|uniref:Uncharacterized protein n=1 Tax=Mytilus galloprovincialis TaxID=29158 RepID=A0A8B6EZ90_MYTGA|nr:Hypothetical predicted protein [Mytilus galloprovincialis]